MPETQRPLHYKTGEAKGAPVCIDLRTYPVKVEAGKVFVLIG
jgi:3-phenylpropionate/trans-cinnamate dioxygenase ferredoxin component